MAKTHRSALELTETGSTSGLYLDSANTTAASEVGNIRFTSGTFELYDSAGSNKLSSTGLILNSANMAAAANTGQITYYSGRGFQAYDGAVFPVTGAAMSRIPTADGTGTGTIPSGVRFVDVGGAEDANSIIILPTATNGVEIWLDGGSTGFELRSDAPTTVAINGGTGAAAESAISGSRLVRCIAVTGGTLTDTGDQTANWICTQFTPQGIESIVEPAE